MRKMTTEIVKILSFPFFLYGVYGAKWRICHSPSESGDSGCDEAVMCPCPAETAPSGVDERLEKGIDERSHSGARQCDK